MRTSTLLLALVWVLLPSGTARAQFHSGGVASCQGCHIMHESEDGALPATGSTGEWLMRGSTASEVCLGCHADSQGEVLGADPLAPPPEYGGGKFVFLLEDNINDSADGALNPIAGHVAGHNVVAPGYGLYPDSDRVAAPGGNFPSSELGCSSCHDPHGNANFRMLYGQGQQTISGFTFSSPAPEAQGIELTGPAEGRSNHTAYLRGWSAWCGNCHGQHHEDSNLSSFEHPTQSSVGGSQQDNYNGYDGTDNPTGGSYTTAYLPEVPLESMSATTDQLTGAESGSQLSCMSCHRAHATSAPNAVRWDPRVLYLNEDGVASGSYAIPNPYLSNTQRQLCEKCHWSDIQMGHPRIMRPCLSCH